MNLSNNNVSQIKYNGFEIDLVKLDGIVIYHRMGLYVPYEFRDRSDIEHVKTLVTKAHTDLSYMFYDSYNLISVNTQDWDTSNVTTMSNMFWGCYYIESLNLSSFNTSNVTDMSGMFTNCFCLHTLDVSNFDTSQVTNMDSIFYGCKWLTSLDLSNWDTSNVTEMGSMFNGCELLTELVLSNWDASSIIDRYDTYAMFNACDNLRILRLDNCSYDTISKIIAPVSNLPTNYISGGVTRKIYCQEKNITNQDGEKLEAPENWVFEFVEAAPGTPEVPEEPEIPEEPETPEIPEEPEDSLLYEPYEFRNDTTLTDVRTIVNDTHTDLSYMFSGCTALETVNTTDWDTSNVRTMVSAFYNCTSLETLNLSSFDTSGVIQMYNMFWGCTNLETLDLSNWNMDNVGSSGYMFSDCESLHTLRLDNCNYNTIYKIVRLSDLPTTKVNGETRKIYCKRENVDTSITTHLVNWELIYVD